MQVVNTNVYNTPFYRVFDVSKPNAPCLGCDRREVGCHGKCKEYQEYKVKLQESNDIIYKNKEKSRSPRSEIFKKHVNNYYYKQKPSKYNT